MAEYIEREAVEKFIVGGLNNSDVYERFGHDAIKIITEVHYMPAADVAPVVHGRWECVYDDGMGETDITCSHCKNNRTVNGCFVSTDGKSCYFEDDYCPNCGAKMDGGED